MYVKVDQISEVIDKLRETLKNYKDAEINADAFYPKETIERNMANYFCGLAETLQILTGRVFNWGRDEKGYRLIETINGTEYTICYV